MTIYEDAPSFVNDGDAGRDRDRADSREESSTRQQQTGLAGFGPTRRLQRLPHRNGYHPRPVTGHASGSWSLHRCKSLHALQAVALQRRAAGLGATPQR
jgi:hypothetical protein